MAERKSTNKYYPPEWEPQHGSVNKFVGQHPLRERARKINQGILIVRFEMPYNVYCEACNNHIAKGRRYNAEKNPWEIISLPKFGVLKCDAITVLLK